MATPKKVSAKAPLPITDKRSKAYKESQKKAKNHSQKERVIAYVPLEDTVIISESGKKCMPSHAARIQELEVHDESTLKLLNELLGRIEKLESIVG